MGSFISQFIKEDTQPLIKIRARARFSTNSDLELGYSSDSSVVEKEGDFDDVFLYGKN